ncbi:MAG: hypothetical protein AB1640_23240 [bacterium]
MPRKGASVFTVLFGLVSGMAGTLAVLAWLPHVELPAIEPVFQESSEGGSVESLFIDLPGQRVAVTHCGTVPLALLPPEIPRLSEPGLSGSVATLASVRNGRGEVVGFAAELEIRPKEDLLGGDPEWDTDWVVVLPGRGTLYLHQTERSRELGREIMAPTLASGLPWQGDRSVQMTSGPLANGRGAILGGTGDFETATGSFVEIDRVTGFLPQGVLVGTVELRIQRES